MPYYLAQGPFQMPNPIQNPSAYGNVAFGAGRLVGNIVTAIVMMSGLLFLLYLLFGAFKYITAGGDDKAVQEAKKILTNAGVGMAMVVSSFFVVDIVGEVLGFNQGFIGGFLPGSILRPVFVGVGAVYPLIGIDNPTGYSSGIGTATSQPVGGFINNITTAIFVFGGILLLVYLFFGAFKYMTAGGDDKATGSAKNTMTNAVIGIVIMVVAFFIVRIAGTVLGLPNILNPTFQGP